MNFFCALNILWISLLPKAGASGGENGVSYPGSPSFFARENIQRQKQIPVLCYHNIGPLKKGNSPAYTIDAEQFNAHIKMLSDSGYTAILPDQLCEYLTNGKTLPFKSIMITFDDSHEDHFTTAAPILKRFGYRGVFFIMTVTIGKYAYLTGAQIKELSDSGHVIAGHTWNHPSITKLKGQDWNMQISRPKEILEKITGRPVQYFAYPYGAWDDKAIDQLKKREIKAAFQLLEKQSEKEPLYTIRRLMVSGDWSAATLYKHIKIFFP